MGEEEGIELINKSTPLLVVDDKPGDDSASSHLILNS